MTQQDTLTGRTIGGYQLVRRLGRGGMASVYLAYDQKLQREVAIKVLVGMDAADEHFAARFQQEALATARLDHPNIIHIYDYGREGDLTYMVMEYCPNGTLLDVLAAAARQGQPVDADYTVQLISQVALALDFAHQRGVVHRDIKPSNILFARDNRPVVADLGIAKALAGPKLTRTQTTVGTPEYMSPEQAKGENVDARSDLYSLGVVLYEMLTGRPPYRAETPWGIIYQHVSEALPPIRQQNPKVSPALASVVERSLAKNPGERFQSGRDMAEALRLAQQKPNQALVFPPVAPARPLPRAQADSPTVVATPAATAPRGRARSSTKNKIGLVALAGVALAVIGVLLAALTLRPPAGSEAGVNAATATPIATAVELAQSTVDPLNPPGLLAGETSSATALPLSFPTPADTATPLITVVERIVEKVVTATPTAMKRGDTPAVQKTPVRTATRPAAIPLPAGATAVPPTAIAAGAAPPILVSPADNSQLSGPVTFSWRWPGPPLATDQGFELRVWDVNLQNHDAAAESTRATQVTVDLDALLAGQLAGGRYAWTVAVVQVSPYKALGTEASPRLFTWSPLDSRENTPVPAELPTPPSPPTAPPTSPPPPTALPTPPPTALPTLPPTAPPTPPPPITEEPTPEPPTPEPTAPFSGSVLLETTTVTPVAARASSLLGIGFFAVFLVAARRTGNGKDRGNK